MDQNLQAPSPGRHGQKSHMVAGPIALSLIANLTFVFMDTSVQYIEKGGISAGEALLLRMVITSPVVFGYVMWKDPQSLKVLSTWSSIWIWLRGIVTAFSLVACYEAIEHITVAQMITLVNLRPFSTAFLCWIWLGEKSSMRQIFGSVLSFAAVILVVQPYSQTSTTQSSSNSGSSLNDSSSLDWLIGTALSLASAVSAGLDFCLTRKIGDTANATVMLLTYAISSIIVGPIWMAMFRKPLVPQVGLKAWLLITTVASLGIVAQITQVLALQRDTGTKIAILGYSGIVFAVILQIVLTGEWPNLIAILGMALIILTGVWCTADGKAPIASEESLDQQKEEETMELIHSPESTFTESPRAELTNRTSIDRAAELEV